MLVHRLAVWGATDPTGNQVGFLGLCALRKAAALGITLGILQQYVYFCSLAIYYLNAVSEAYQRANAELKKKMQLVSICPAKPSLKYHALQI